VNGLGQILYGKKEFAMKAVLSLLLSIMMGMSLVSCASYPTEIEETETVQQKLPGREDLVLEGAQSHKVVWRDTFARLARRYYGANNGYYYPLIMLAQPTLPPNPNLLVSGTTVTIPALQANLDNPVSRKVLRAYMLQVADWHSQQPLVRDAKAADAIRALAAGL
jgi:hypothetical protein